MLSCWRLQVWHFFLLMGKMELFEWSLFHTICGVTYLCIIVIWLRQDYIIWGIPWLFDFFKDFLIKLGGSLKWSLEDMLTSFLSSYPSWIIFEKSIEIVVDVVPNISAMAFWLDLVLFPIINSASISFCSFCIVTFQ